MTTTINASTSSGLVSTADGSGILKVQSNGVTTNAIAWVNFNGTGTVAIRAAYNVSSITDNGTGDYTLNFTNALTDANYAPAGMVGTSQSRLITATSKTTSALRIAVVVSTSNTNVDETEVTVAIFGN